ncbi:MAG: hypothetical protein ACR2MB_03495 [Acidimicrobiales bacterium]
MSPVDQSRGHVGRAASVALIGVFVMAVGLGGAALLLNRQPSKDLRLGDQRFEAGLTRRLAPEIADRGPIFFGDVSGRKDRDIILQHLGSKREKGWLAFLAFPPDRARSCTWQWQAKERLFRAKCDRKRTAPADGKGLPQFPVKVANGHIEVDLNADARTKAAPTTTTTKGGG